MNEKKLKHLEFIQNIISRMAGNLFYLRGWVVTIFVGALAVLSQNTIVNVIPLIIFIVVSTLVFWGYDGYFLSQERMYRGLYEKVSNMSEKSINFSMDISEFKVFTKNNIIFCMFSRTLVFFYAPILVTFLTLFFYFK